MRILYGFAPAIKAWLAFVLNNPSSDARIGPPHYSPPLLLLLLLLLLLSLLLLLL